MTPEAKRLAKAEKQNLRLLKIIRKAFQQAESYRIHAAIRTLGDALNKYAPRIPGEPSYELEKTAWQSEPLYCTKLDWSPMDKVVKQLSKSGIKKKCQ